MGIRTLYQSIAANPEMRKIGHVASWLFSLGGLIAATFSGYRAFEAFFVDPVFSMIKGNGWLLMAGLACGVVALQYVSILFGLDLLDRNKKQ